LDSVKWFWAVHPVPNVLDRLCPFWWSFDPVCRYAWLRSPPPDGIKRSTLYMPDIVTPEHFAFRQAESFRAECDHCHSEQAWPLKPRVACPGCGVVQDVSWDPDDLEIEGHVYVLIGIRAQESPGRKLGVIAQGGHIATRRNRDGTLNVWPIYDWTEGDVWLAIKDHCWDYNSAYTDMLRAGWPRNQMRVASITLSSTTVKNLQHAKKTWPSWFDRVCDRIDGVVDLKSVADVFPKRSPGESWESFFWDICVDTAPAWIADRARRVASHFKKRHANHSCEPFPDSEACVSCSSSKGSWQQLVRSAYGGDPFSLSFSFLDQVDPASFRPILEERWKNRRGPAASGVTGPADRPAGRASATSMAGDDYSEGWKP
jgi:predicted phosphoadenosine phosphosulfate sulfurtransferase